MTAEEALAQGIHATAVVVGGVVAVVGDRGGVFGAEVFFLPFIPDGKPKIPRFVERGIRPRSTRMDIGFIG